MTEILNSRTAHEWLKTHIRFDVEEAWALALDSRLRLIAGEMLFRGSVRQCPMHPRELFLFGLKHSAVSMILAHSHPSGDPEPSKEDLELTKRLYVLGRCLEIPLADHLIVAKDGFTSLADRGHFKTWSRAKLTLP